MYNASLKSKMDYEGSIAFAEQKAYLKGKEDMAGVIAFAEDKAFEKGVQQERAKAEIEKLEGKRETARNLKNIGIAIQDVAKGTGLTIEEIESL